MSRHSSRVSKICDFCGRPFTCESNESERGRRFCRRECFYASRRRPVVREARQAIRHAYECGYRANPDGSIVGPDGEPVRLTMNNTGRRYYCFSVPLVRSAIQVHRFIAYQIYGESALEAACVRHRNDDGHDNRFENILIGTRLENILDMPPEKRSEKSRRAQRPFRKLADDQVREARMLLAQGHSLSDIGRRLHVSARSILDIKRGRCYADVQP